MPLNQQIQNLLLALVFMFNGISTLFRLFNAKP